MKKLFLSLFLLISVLPVSAQSMYLSLDSCLSMAIHNNKDLSIQEIKQEVAALNKKEAFTHFLPRIEAIGTYQRTEKEISLLSSDQKTMLSNMGSVVGEQLTPILTQAAMANPQMAPYIQQIGGIATGLLPSLNGIGETIVEALRTDTRNVTAATLMLTQPLYMGGKIIAYNKITKYAEQIAASQHDQKLQELLVSVESAYWQIVSLESKKTIAESYKKLIDTLDYNVEVLIEEGMASKADGLSVKVKKNEADVTLIQLDNGLALSKMLLCQLCGIDINSDIHLTETTDNLELMESPGGDYIDTAIENRPELTSLALLSKINKEKVKITLSEYLPKAALTGNYIWTNPSVFNGFQNKMKGMWAVGVMVNVPIWNWGESYYKVKAAKKEARIAEMTLDEAREKIELQTTQCAQKVIEAINCEETAQRSMAQAEENLRYANLGMQEGVIPISNVLAAQTAWLSAKSTVVTARIDRKLAQVNLKRATGTLTY